MKEREMEDLLWEHPEKFLNEALEKFERQLRSEVGQSDLIFLDRINRLIVIELKHGTLDRKAVPQLVDYYGMVKHRFPGKAVELMIIANRIPPERRVACQHHEIEAVEISEKKFRDVAEEVGYVFKSEAGGTSISQAGLNRQPDFSDQTSRGSDQSWVFRNPGKPRSDAPEFLARCDELGKKFFTGFFELQKGLAGKTKITWEHESGFSMQFYFRRLGYVEMVWGFPSVNRKGVPSRNNQSLVFPFDFASRRGIPDNFITDFGRALSDGCPLAGGTKRPSVPVSYLSPTETEHIFRTIAGFSEKASSVE